MLIQKVIGFVQFLLLMTVLTVGLGTVLFVVRIYR